MFTCAFSCGDCSYLHFSKICALDCRYFVCFGIVCFCLSWFCVVFCFCFGIVLSWFDFVNCEMIFKFAVCDSFLLVCFFWVTEFVWIDCLLFFGDKKKNNIKFVVLFCCLPVVNSQSPKTKINNSCLFQSIMNQSLPVSYDKEKLVLKKKTKQKNRCKIKNERRGKNSNKTKLKNKNKHKQCNNNNNNNK